MVRIVLFLLREIWLVLGLLCWILDMGKFIGGLLFLMYIVLLLCLFNFNFCYNNIFK